MLGLRAQLEVMEDCLRPMSAALQAAALALNMAQAKIPCELYRFRTGEPQIALSSGLANRRNGGAMRVADMGAGVGVRSSAFGRHL